ncbi:protein timeless homolog [Diadema antillarum]|uniref:protein timeless homolog n=1 Tax=Diadema antillarum TaxID=105358 RepID=UPI003A847708
MAVDVLNPINMNCELLATCNALGYLEGNTYQKEPDCLETIKDLIRFLRREDETCAIRRQLGHAQILQNDLIPLTKQYHKEGELFETSIRLLVNLTQPAELCFQNVPNDKTFQNYFLEVLSHLQAYKQAFACEEFMTVLAKKLKKLLDMEWESRREDHTLLMERILLLVRNILHIPADPNAEKRTDDDASIHDQVLWALNVSGMDKLILYIASAEGEQQWCMHAVEIISHMLREQTPESLAQAGTSQQASERQREARELEQLRQREMAEKRARIMKASGRHSRFGGSFYMKDFKSISERDLIYHRSLQNAKTMTFESEKGPTKKPKNRLPMMDKDISRRSTLSIRLFLKDFCILLMDNCYNPLMNAVKDHILHHRAQENDESYYLWAMHFFMQFNRHHKFRIDVISETFSVQTFHYVDTQITKYLDMMTTDKKETTAWSKRMHLGLKAYRELLASLNEMAGPSSAPELRESADVIQNNLFYVVEYREIFITLLKKFDEVKNTRTYLKDLVETTHIFIKMLEKYSKKKKTLMVQKKTKKKAKRRKRRQPQQEAGQSHNAQEQEDQLNDVWNDTLASELSAMLQEREDIPENVSPFDAASEVPMEEQRTEAMVKIQQSLRAGRAGEALALFRASREVWPEGDVFGASDIEPEDEFMALREIHFTNLNVQQPEPAQADTVEEQEEYEEDEEDEMAMEEQMTRGEEEFNFAGYINKLCHPAVIKSYIKLLGSFRSNQAFTNHCIIKLLHRICLECDKTQLLFQVSLFRIFHKILQDPLAKTDQFKEMAKFGQYVVGRFFKALPSNPKLVVELLFWKDASDIYQIQEGYGAVQPSKKSKGKEWTEEEQAELAGLFEQYRDVDTRDDGKDVVDLIMDHIIDDSKTRRQIVSQLVKQELIDSAKDLKKEHPKKLRFWREEHELELRTLFEQHKDADDILGAILEHMQEKRSRNKVMQKILELGLVQDRKELYKKRRRKGDGGDGARGRRRRRGRGDGDEDLDDEADEFADGLQEFPDDSEQEFTTSESDDHDDESEDDEEDSEKEDDGEERQLGEMVTKLQRKGYVEQIRWIQEGLRSTAGDREESDENQAVPVVPLGEDNDRAMRNKTFQKFLRRIGLSEPKSHEEIYWRIPGELEPSELRELADTIEPREGVEAVTKDRQEKRSKKSNARYQMLKEMALSRRKERKEGSSRRKQRRERTEPAETGHLTEETARASGVNVTELYDAETDVSGDDNDDDDAGGAAPVESAVQRSRIKRSLPTDSSSDDSDDDNLETFLNKNRVTAPSQAKPTKRSRLVSSDDSDREDTNRSEGQAKFAKLEEKSHSLLKDNDGNDDKDGSGIEDVESGSQQIPTITSQQPSASLHLVLSDDGDDEGGDKNESVSNKAINDDSDDSKSEIIEIVSSKKKRALKKQAPFDFSEDEDSDDKGVNDEDGMEDAVMETGAHPTKEDSPTHDQSLHLVLSEDSPSDADVTMREDATTTMTEDDDDDDEDKEEEVAEESVTMEDNATNFLEDDTSNTTTDNAASCLDNNATNENKEVTMETADTGDDEEWEEILDDDSDFNMTSSNSGVAKAIEPTPEASSESDSDDDVPLRRVAKRRVVSSDSDE